MGTQTYHFSELKRAERYGIMTATIVPRPIAVVSTLNENGTVNLAPFSYFNAVSSEPACLMFSVTTKRGPDHTFIKKDTLLNIERTQEFVVHISSVEHLPIVEKASADLPTGLSELELIRKDIGPMTEVAATWIKTPRIAEFKVAYECTLEKLVDFGSNTVVFGKIVGVHLTGKGLESLTPDPFELDPLARLSKDYAGISPLNSIRN